VIAEAPLFVAATALDLVEFGWDEDSVAHPEEFSRPLLSCGHYDRPVFEGSSQWDFPHDEHVCPTCGETRQWDLRVQAAIIEWWKQS
jgi:hypothetical protein